MSGFTFRVLQVDKKTKARVGEIRTPHGVIKTPAFVPVGTQGTVKSLTPEELETVGTQIFFVNTYHMYLRPGFSVIKKFGGLHRFMNWHHPIITDSGGFQVFSLARNQSGAQDTFFKDVRQPYDTDRHTSSASLSETPSVYTDTNANVYRGRGFSAFQNGLAHPLTNLVNITDDGVQFRSHWDGSKHLFTPELSMKYQWQLGSDIHIAFDDCTPYPATHEQAKVSMARTHRWAVRSLEAHQRCSSSRDPDSIGRIEKSIQNSSRLRSNNNLPQALYGVVQGSTFEDLRKESAKFIRSMDFDGIAIGGVSVGESKKEMAEVLGWVTPFLPYDKPRHLLGVGEIDDIFTLVESGMDTFDCVQPTRLARTGHVYIKEKGKRKKPACSPRSTSVRRDGFCEAGRQGRVKGNWTFDITKRVFAEDAKPIDETCQCYTCHRFSRAYLHHLFSVRELLGYRLATIHNVHFINSLMCEIRTSIIDNTFLELKKKWLYNNFKL